MNSSTFVPPAVDSPAFNCLHCRIYARQEWSYLNIAERPDGCGRNRCDKRFRVSFCFQCGYSTIWLEGRIVYPNSSGVEPPNAHIADDIRADYEEAAAIVGLSPRGAAALLRLTIQKLCKQLGESGENINSDIGALVAKGLPIKIQQALDVVRVVGNNAVHPGQITFDDNREMALSLFRLVNIIAEKMLSDAAEIEALYAGLPQTAVAAIDRRDAGKS